MGGATGSDGGSPAGTGESGGSEGGTGRGDEGTGTGGGTGGDLTASQELAKAAAVVAPGEEEEDGSEHANVGGSAEKGSLLDNPAGQALIAGALIADFVTTVASLGKLVGKFLAKGVAKGVSFLAGKIAQGFTAAKEAVGSAASAIGGFFKKLFGKETARDAPKLLPAPRMVRHHIFNKFRGRSPASQKYRDFFKKHGIEVDKWTVEIPEAMHKE